jgi:hypothetical protein
MGIATNLVAWHSPSALGDELLNTLVNLWSCGDDFVLL